VEGSFWEEEIEVTRRQGRIRKKLLDDLKDRRGYCHLKEEAFFIDNTTCFFDLSKQLYLIIIIYISIYIFIFIIIHNYRFVKSIDLTNFLKFLSSP
jgi:hypothetical protein